MNDRKRFLGIFIIALAIIAYQVLLTRIFSVVLYYHFAFAGISLAMLGMTIGALRIYFHPEHFAGPKFDEEWAKAALNFSMSSVALVMWFLFSPIVIPQPLILGVLALSLLLFVIPFTYGGICVTMILTSSANVGRLYAADLIGAALGCFGIVQLLYVLDPVSIIFLLSALSAFAALKMAGAQAQIAAKAKKIMLILLAIGSLQGAQYVAGQSHIGVLWAKENWQTHRLYERWNAFSYIQVGPWSTDPMGWGFGHPQKGKIEQRYLNIDASAGTVLIHFDGDLKPLSYLSNDIINMGYHIRPVQSVAVIGVGGGRDVMSGLYFGAKKILALEINPAIVEVLTHTFADFTGHFTERPEVTLINTEARSWLSQHHPPVDLVQISLIDTWAATAAGGLTLSENRLYTTEAWKEFLSTLSPKGMLAVSRWYERDKYDGEFYRLLSLAASSLKAVGIPAAEIRRHILAFSVGKIITVVTSPSPFSPEEVTQARQQAADLGFTVVVAPDAAQDETSRVIASGEATEAFYDHLPLDVSAPTDNRPFFFFMTRAGDAFNINRPAGGRNAANNNSLTVMLILLIGTLLLTIGFIINPLMKLSGRLPAKGVIPHLTYFGGIGLGFMLVEISQMQRLMVFLGHPVYGLSVVLFTLLLSGGIGSLTVSAADRPKQLWLRPLLLCLVLIATGLITPVVTAQLVVFGTAARIVISALLLAPAGFCMGTMFPNGMRMSAAHRNLQPWFWGINGAVSVFASIFGVAVSMLYGISAAYWLGVAAYGLCLWLAIRQSKTVHPADIK